MELTQDMLTKLRTIGQALKLIFPHLRGSVTFNFGRESEPLVDVRVCDATERKK